MLGRQGVQGLSIRINLQHGLLWSDYELDIWSNFQKMTFYVQFRAPLTRLNKRNKMLAT